MKLWFGEHDGKELEDVPSSYLRWLIDNVEVRSKPEEHQSRYRDLLSEAEDELEDRGY